MVLLCPSDLDSTLRMLLQVPLWSQRVTYLKGSALIDEDLIRARYELAVSSYVVHPIIKRITDVKQNFGSYFYHKHKK